MAIDVFNEFCRSLVPTIGKLKLKICSRKLEIRDFELILCVKRSDRHFKYLYI